MKIAYGLRVEMEGEIRISGAEIAHKSMAWHFCLSCPITWGEATDNCLGSSLRREL
jgi:hypothetical protein